MLNNTSDANNNLKKFKDFIPIKNDSHSDKNMTKSLSLTSLAINHKRNKSDKAKTHDNMQKQLQRHKSVENIVEKPKQKVIKIGPKQWAKKHLLKGVKQNLDEMELFFGKREISYDDIFEDAISIFESKQGFDPKRLNKAFPLASEQFC